jgi:hypothetical protein
MRIRGFSASLMVNNFGLKLTARRLSSHTVGRVFLFACYLKIVKLDLILSYGTAAQVGLGYQWSLGLGDFCPYRSIHDQGIAFHTRGGVQLQLTFDQVGAGVHISPPIALA